MPLFRTVVAGLAGVPAVLIAWLAFAFNGFEDENYSGPLNTLPFAVPWTVATGALAALVVGAALSRSKRPSLSAWACGLASAMYFFVFVWLFAN